MPTVMRSPVGVLGLLLALTVVGSVGFVAARVHLVTHPPRASGERFDFAAMRLSVEEVELQASDGVPLAAWWLRGDPNAAAIVLAHDWGADKGSLTQLAVGLQARGFNLLMVDLRGHGASGAASATFGPAEKRDLLGAIDLLQQRGFDAERIGLYGVGMGAYAALLAADDRPRLSTLVLDGLYADANAPLVRRVYGAVPAAGEWFGFAPRLWFHSVHLRGASAPASEELMPRFFGRNLLLLVSDSDAELHGVARRVVAALPEQADVDGNLVVLPATLSEGLYGEDLDRYTNEVVEFFASRL